jgi:3-methyladenine DNA glycosylase AlkD
MISNDVFKELEKYSDPVRAKHSMRFFKTGPGQYGEGDQFIGIRVPKQRLVAKQFRSLELKEIQKLLDSPIHEHRLTGLIILTLQFPNADKHQQETIVNLYLNNARKGRINNWDLVDTSAHKVLGHYLEDKDRSILYDLANSGQLWQERISVIATAWFIGKGDFEDTIKLSAKFLNHPHDLMHKATGWMLREVGKRDLDLLLKFLDQYASRMPRTMLSYSIEKLTTKQRAHYRSL